MSIKDLRLVARVYNNQLRERREATGLSASVEAEIDPFAATRTAMETP